MTQPKGSWYVDIMRSRAAAELEIARLADAQGDNSMDTETAARYWARAKRARTRADVYLESADRFAARLTEASA